MTECNHNGEEIDFKLKAKPCTKCGKLLDLHEWTATIRRGATLAENKRVLDEATKILCRKNRCADGCIELARKELASLRLKGDDKK